MQPPARCHLVVDAVEEREPHRRVQLRHLPVDADAAGLLLAPDGEVAERADPFEERRVVARDRPALRGVKDLRRVKAEYAQVAAATDPAPAAGGPERLRGVVDDPEPAPARDALERGNVARIAED